MFANKFTIKVKLIGNTSCFNDTTTGFFINKGEIKEVVPNAVIAKAIEDRILEQDKSNL